MLDCVKREHGSDADALARLRRAFALQRYRCTTALDHSAYQFVQVNAPSVPAEELKYRPGACHAEAQRAAGRHKDRDGQRSFRYPR